MLLESPSFTHTDILRPSTDTLLSFIRSSALTIHYDFYCNRAYNVFIKFNIVNESGTCIIALEVWVILGRVRFVYTFYWTSLCKD